VLTQWHPAHSLFQNPAIPHVLPADTEQVLAVAFLGSVVLLLIVLAISWHLHPEAPGLVLVLVMFGPAFVYGLGMMLGAKNRAPARLFGLLLVGATGWVLLWGVSLVL
jgi:hypothetical protein